jgi:hypothetical protein
MDKYGKYDKETQQQIIEIGVFLYEKTREHVLRNVEGGGVQGEEERRWEGEYELTRLRRQVQELTVEKQRALDRVHQVREEEYRKSEERMERQRNDLEAERNRATMILQTVDADRERVVKMRTEELMRQLVELRAKNAWYYSMYEDKSKGKNYEEELYPRLLDYNDRCMNSVWVITHVGSVLSEKTDFHFRHKEMGVVILLDTKNNLPTNPVASTAEFERDVLRKETGAIGGVMLANGNICNKKRFEMNKVKDKYMVFVSEFDRENVAFIFVLLGWMLEIANAEQAVLSKEVLRGVLVDAYKRECLTMEVLEKGRKQSQKVMDGLLEEYRRYFDGDDIEMGMKNEEVMASSVRVKEKVSADVVSVEDLEKDRRVIGVRSKYYLQYEDVDGVQCLQYFKNNYARNQKVKALETKGTENVVLTVETSAPTFTKKKKH